MTVTIKAVGSRSDLRAYIYLPEQIHRKHSNWLPPIYMDEWTYYNPEKNKAFSFCDTCLWLAYKADKPVGRIMGIINHPYNERKGEKTVRFEHFECYDDPEVARALLNTVEEWGRRKGMTEIVGPFGFSDKDPEGLLIDGFDKLPILVTPCNLPYLPALIEAEGYEKKIDCLDFIIDLRKGVPDFYPRIYERVKRNTYFKLIEFQKTSELKPYIGPVFYLINDTYKDIYGFQPLDDQEIKEMVDRYLMLLDPRFVKVVLDENNKLIAFIVGLPNMTKGIQRARGRLFPLGLFHIWRAAKTTKQLDLMLGAIDEQYRGRGIDILMGWKMIESARQAGIETLETHLVLETNTRMLAEYEKMGAQLHKRFRVYRKDLS